MISKIRPNPTIPDHDVLRKIGGGAYGEVWLARGVTGALRAVKVVRREDFEDERSFEREFDGILKFEPISRDHPALVNILHVGRSGEGEGEFYFYVMELGDDVHSGREINPVEYEPRTLRGDHHSDADTQWSVEECIDVGLRLAEALQHLHQNGLAHRDVKPSNVIFVNGRAKLADIGLVAARGQRTFVGTEGFVPPEGPGSAQADVYSLGKVLYEIATGMDRMNFPELPSRIPADGDRRLWLELNRIICEICEPRISKRKISTAAALAASLRRLQLGKRRRHRGIPLVFTAMLLAGFAGVLVWQSYQGDTQVVNSPLPPSQPEPAIGQLRVISTPEGADVYTADGEFKGTTPTKIFNPLVGEEVSYTLRKQGYRPLVVECLVGVSAVKEPMVLLGEMQVFSPPVAGEPWIDHIDNVYLPDGDSHVSSHYVSRKLWEQAKAAVKPANGSFEYLETTENGEPSEVVLTTEKMAERLCSWLLNNGVAEGYLTEDHEVRPVMDLSFMNPDMSKRAIDTSLRPFRLEVHKINYGQIYITSEPPGAELFINNKPVGVTHGELIIPGIKPGPVNLLLVLEGYKPLSKRYTMKEGGFMEDHLVLTKNQGVVFGRPWENSLGMKFVPLGKDLMVAVWETRVRDYDVFVGKSGHAESRLPFFDQGPNHPVVNVSRDDAIAFCKWLTNHERRLERISKNHYYRLPTDMEWSEFVGLENEDALASPGWRDSRKEEVFPWGDSWAEAKEPGNFADMTAAGAPGVDVDRTIAGYNDGYAFTAPVGSFPPNEQSLYDLSGNVQEWVSDPYSNTEDNVLGVLRGGGWNTYQKENLYSGSRNAVPPGYSDSMYGFRVVLAKEQPKTED